MLTTLAKVKNRLPNLSEETFDGLLSDLIGEVSCFIESECDRKFEEAEYTEKFDGQTPQGELTRIICLNQYPIKEIASIKYDGPDAGSQIEIPSTGYIIDHESGEIIHATGYWPKGIKNIEVVYTAGWKTAWTEAGAEDEEHVLPRDLTGIATKLVVREFKKRESVGKRSEGVSGDNINWLDEIDADIMRTIAHYKRMDF